MSARRSATRLHIRRTVAGIYLSAAALLTVAPLAAEGTRRSGRAFVVPIRGEINDVMRRSLERRVERARQAGADMLVFEIDTLGGLVTSAIDISTLIKKLPDQGVRTVAWVNDKAISAGAMISVAAQEIVMSPASRIGDCAPIMVTPTGGLEELGDTERAKAESPVLVEFRDSAHRNGYDALLCRAMVTVGEEVWWLENTQTAERKFVDGEEKKRLIDKADAELRQWKLVDEKGIRQPVDSATELLTVYQREAVLFGFARAIISDLSQMRAHYELGSLPVMLEISGWEKFALWLNNPIVRGVLFVIMLLGAYIEFQHPGLILPGATALIALAIFLAAPYAAGLADIWTLVLLVIGLVLLGIEIFVIPGFGIVGVLGIMLILAAFVGTFVPSEPGAPPFSIPTFQGTWDAIKLGIMTLSISVIAAVIGIALLARYLPHAPIAGRMVLANPSAEALALRDPYAGVAQVGDVGVVVGDLRPGGTVRFGQHIVDAQSQGEYVVSGARVQVLSHEGMRIVVRPLPNA